VQCVVCNAELLEGKRFCVACGAEAAARCPQCGAAVQLTFRFCPDCGTRLAPAEPAAAAPPPKVPEELAQKLRAASPPTLEERKLVTVLFCDLVRSTELAEQLDAEVYRALLTRYFETAERILRGHGATLERSLSSRMRRSAFGFSEQQPPLSWAC